MDFPSGKKLSEYLQSLKSNFSAYLQYHKWRQLYHVGNFGEDVEQLKCEICRRLKREKDTGYAKKYIIDNLADIFANKQTCIK